MKLFILVFQKHKSFLLMHFIFSAFFASTGLVTSMVVAYDLNAITQLNQIKVSDIVSINLAALLFYVCVNMASAITMYNYTTIAKNEMNLKFIDSIFNGKSNAKASAMDYVRTISNDVDILSDNYFGAINSLIYFFFSFLAGTYYIFNLSLYFGVFIIMVSLISVVGSKMLSKRLSVTQMNTLELMNNVNKRIVEFFRNISFIRFYNMTSVIHGETIKNNSDYIKFYKKSLKIPSIITLFNDTMTYVIKLGIFLLGFLLIRLNIITVAEVVSASIASTMISVPISWAGTVITKLSKSKMVSRTFLESIEKVEGGISAKKKTIENIDQIEFIDFGLKVNDVQIFENYNQKINRGDRVAIIGDSGRGKTTLINCLLNLNQDYSGKILINQCDLKEVDLQESKCITYVEQDGLLLNRTIRENITLLEEVDEAKLNRSIIGANLQDLIANRGQGYLINENNTSISGGEKKKITLARAFYHSNPQSTVILDEAFSNLDNQSAREISRYLENNYSIIISIIHKQVDKINYNVIIDLNNSLEEW